MTEPAVRLEHVTKSFDGRRVLDDVTLEVPAGAGFCLLGRSGTGKSVTLKHIVRLVAPDAGRVLVEGRDLAGLSAEALAAVRRRIGFVFQHGALFDSISVGENVAFVLRRHTRLPEAEIRARARERLARVGLADAYDLMPAALSGGMRKRAGLARALALDPPILLVDEPSAGLDPLTAGEIDELLLALKRERGATLVVVTHDMASARLLADRIAVLDRGRVVAEGTVEALERHTDPLVHAFLHSSRAG
jgi:phospholipid/cholesterol/gamma-HCH transport system ATP-binding protein